MKNINRGQRRSISRVSGIRSFSEGYLGDSPLHWAFFMKLAVHNDMMQFWSCFRHMIPNLSDGTLLIFWSEWRRWFQVWNCERLDILSPVFSCNNWNNWNCNNCNKTPIRKISHQGNAMRKAKQDLQILQICTIKETPLKKIHDKNNGKTEEYYEHHHGLEMILAQGTEI